MSRLSARDAAQLAAEIKRVVIAAHAISERQGHGSVFPAMVGGLEVVLRSFVGQHCGSGDAVRAISAAFHHKPTAEELAARERELDSILQRSERAKAAA